MRQLQLFSSAELAVMRDRTKSHSHSPERDEFRRDHERHRAWGLTQRHAQKLRRRHPGIHDRPAPNVTQNLQTDATRDPPSPLPPEPLPPEPTKTRQPARNHRPARIPHRAKRNRPTRPSTPTSPGQPSSARPGQPGNRGPGQPGNRGPGQPGKHRPSPPGNTPSAGQCRPARIREKHPPRPTGNPGQFRQHIGYGQKQSQ
jgi:hypothetical protein